MFNHRGGPHRRRAAISESWLIIPSPCHDLSTRVVNIEEGGRGGRGGGGGCGAGGEGGAEGRGGGRIEGGGGWGGGEGGGERGEGGEEGWGGGGNGGGGGECWRLPFAPSLLYMSNLPNRGHSGTSKSTRF